MKIKNLGYSNSETKRYAALLNGSKNRTAFLEWASVCVHFADNLHEGSESLARRLRQNCERYAPQGKGVYKNFDVADIERIDWGEIADTLVKRSGRSGILKTLNRFGI